MKRVKNIKRYFNDHYDILTKKDKEKIKSIISNRIEIYMLGGYDE